MTTAQIWFIIWLATGPLGVFAVYVIDMILWHEIMRPSTYLKVTEEYLVKSDELRIFQETVAIKIARTCILVMIVVPMVSWLGAIRYYKNHRTHKGS